MAAAFVHQLRHQVADPDRFRRAHQHVARIPAGHLGQVAALRQRRHHRIDQADGSLDLPGERRGVEHLPLAGHGPAGPPQDHQRHQDARAHAGGVRCAFELVGVRVLQREGEFRPQQQDHPGHVHPQHEHRHRGERAVDAVVVHHARLHHGEHLHPAEEHDRRQQAADERGAQAHPRVRHEDVQEADHEPEDAERGQVLRPGVDVHVEDLAVDGHLRLQRAHQADQHRHQHQHARVVRDLPQQAPVLVHAPDPVEALLHVRQQQHRRQHEERQADPPQRREIGRVDDVEDLLDEFLPLRRHLQEPLHLLHRRQLVRAKPEALHQRKAHRQDRHQRRQRHEGQRRRVDRQVVVRVAPEQQVPHADDARGQAAALVVARQRADRAQGESPDLVESLKQLHADLPFPAPAVASVVPCASSRTRS